MEGVMLGVMGGNWCWYRSWFLRYSSSLTHTSTDPMWSLLNSITSSSIVGNWRLTLLWTFGREVRSVYYLISSPLTTSDTPHRRGHSPWPHWSRGQCWPGADPPWAGAAPAPGADPWPHCSPSPGTSSLLQTTLSRHCACRTRSTVWCSRTPAWNNINHIVISCHVSYLHGWLIRFAAYCSIALNASAAFNKLKSGFHLAELPMISPVVGDTNFLWRGTNDK